MPGPAQTQGSPNNGLGSLSSESLGEMAQQMGGGSSSASQTQPSAQQMQAMQQQMAGGQTDQKAREVGSLGEELVSRPLEDITKGIRSIFSIDNLLGQESQKPDPESQAKKKQLHQRFNQLTQEEQAVARQRYQQEMERKQRMAEEDQLRKQQEAQSKQAIQMPSSPQKGNGGQSKKQSVMQQLQDDRTKIGKVQGAN